MKNNQFRAAIAENPVLVLFWGACPAMAVTNSVIGALGMGAAVLLVMLLSAFLISLLRKAIPEKARIPACILITAGFVSIVQLLMNAFLPTVYPMLGVYLAVAAVNLLVFSSAERASERSVGASVLDSLLTGLGFWAALLVMGAVREILGSGSFAGASVPFFETYNVPLLTQASGGFLVFAILAAVINAVFHRDCTEDASLTCAAAGLCELETQTEGE